MKIGVEVGNIARCEDDHRGKIPSEIRGGLRWDHLNIAGTA